MFIYDENFLKLVVFCHDHECCTVLKKVIKRSGQDIGIILIHELFQTKLVEIRNFEHFK